MFVFVTPSLSQNIQMPILTEKVPNTPILSEIKIIGIDPFDKMPIVSGGYSEQIVAGRTPIAQRGIEYRKFLAPSIKIQTTSSEGVASGSGTICYYDPVKNLAYVATCGHLWDSGIMTSKEGLRRNITCKAILFYHNEEKLAAPKEYTAKVIFYSYVKGCDTALITFQPDFNPEYFPVAPVDYEVKPGSKQHSLGCDAGSEVAHYEVEIVGIQGPNLISKNNSPRRGRSGGGLLSDDGYYIGTCWGTSILDGSGIGYFTPIPVIHNFWNQQAGYEFLLKQTPGSNMARSLPIIDRNSTQGIYPKNYIPVPSR